MRLGAFQGVRRGRSRPRACPSPPAISRCGQELRSPCRPWRLRLPPVSDVDGCQYPVRCGWEVRLVRVEGDVPEQAGEAGSVMSWVDGDRLRTELAAARAEIVLLRAENDRLRSGRPEGAGGVHRSQRAASLFDLVPDLPVGVDQDAPAESKVCLYRALFSGRRDVYALRWENSAIEKSGWSPATLGGPGRGGSSLRRYVPVDDGVISSHLAGRTTAGVYPLIDGDRCWFLACDFDKGSWALDALAFLGACADAGVPAALERSRSGNGAHAWIFFEKPIPAATARRLGTGLLRRTMALRAEVDLASYDRLFPSQDFVLRKGFGNLIALPLQGRCRREGTTVFIDPATLEPWEDQWAFLDSIRRLSAADAKSIGEDMRVEAGPGTGSLHRRAARPGPPPPPTIAATLEATLAVDRIGLPPALLASLKHLASVYNPEFHQREQLRLSTWNTPRMIRCYDEDLDRLYLPRGLTDETASIVAAAGSHLEIGDRRPPITHVPHVG